MTSHSEPTSARGPGRTILRLSARAILVLLAVAAALVAALHTPWGVQTAVNLTLRLARPFPETELSVSGARGGFLSGIELYDVRLRRNDGSLEATVDTLSVRYRIEELIGRPLRFRKVLVAGARVTARWPVERRPNPTAKGGQANLAVDRIDVRRARGRLYGRPVGRDSVLEVGHLGLAVSRLHVATTTSLTLDTLAAVLRAPAAPAATLHLAVAGKIDAGRVELRALTLVGDRTRVAGAGTICLPSQDGAGFEGTDFRITFAPLAGGDIRRFLPPLGDPGDITLDLAAQGDASALHATLAARAERGGHVKLEADLPPHAGGPALRTDGLIRDLNLGAILGDGSQRLVVSARWTADLAGPDAARISGPVSLDLTGSRVGPTRLDEARLTGRFDEGRAAFRLRGAASAFSLKGSGWVTPFTAPAAYELSGALSVPRISRSNAGAVLLAGAVPFRVQGRGNKLGSAVATISAELHPDDSASPLIGPGRVAVALDSGLVTWHAESWVANGTARADGEVRLVPAPSFRVREGVVDGVNLALLAGDTTHCRLSAEFRAEGQGFRPDSMRAVAEIASLTLVYGAHELRDGRVNLNLVSNRGRLKANAVVDSAALDIEASISPLSGPREAWIAGRFRDLDLGKLTAGKAPRSRIAGRLNAQVAGPDLKALLATPRSRDALGRTRGTFRLELEPSTVLEHALDVFSLNGDLAHGTLSVRGRAEFTSPAARLAGTLEGRASGLDERSLDADATLDLSGSRIHRLTFDRLLARARLSSGHLDARLDLGSGSDSAAVVLAAEPFGDPIRLRTTGDLRFDHLGELLGIDSLQAGATLSLAAEGEAPRSGGPRDVMLAARLTGGANAGDARLDTIAVECGVKQGVVHVARLALRGNFLAADGTGFIALPRSEAAESTSFRLEGAFGAIDPLAPLLGLKTLYASHGRFHLSAAGPATATTLTADASIRRPHVNDGWADSLAVQFSCLAREGELANLKARLDARSLVVWPLAPRDVNAAFGWDGRELSADVRSRRTGDLHETLSLRLEPRDGGLRGRLDRLKIDRQGGTISLESPAEFEIGKRLFLSNLVLLDNGAPLLRAHGTLEETGPIELEVHLDSADLGYLGEIWGLPAVKGRVSVDGTLTRTRERPAADVALKARVIAGSREPATLNGRLRWADGMLDLSTSLDQTPDNGMALTARLPLTLSLATAPGASPVALTGDSMRAELTTRRFDLSWFEPFISPRVARGLRGWVDGTIRAEGDPESPALSGRFILTEGRAELPSLGVKFQDGEASIGLSGRTVTLERAALKSGGSLVATGKATLEGPGRRTVDLGMKLQRFVPVNTSQAKAELSGGIQVSGKLEAPRVQGDLTLQKTTIYAEKGTATKLEPVALSRRDLLDLQERFGVGVGAPPKQGSAFGDSADFDVSVKVGDNVWVRRRSDPIVALELQGGVRVRRPPGAVPDVRGTLGIRTGRSYLSFLGRRFEMQAARVELPGPVDSSSAHLEAFYAPPANGTSSADITVKAVVEIDPSGVVTDLQSEPYLDRTSLLNYLATGEVQGGTGSGTAYGLAVGSAVGAVGGAAGRSLGLDVVTVTMDAYGGQTLGAGSYVNPRVYLGFRQPVVEGKKSGNASTSSSSTTEFEVEVEALRNLLVNLQGSSAQYRFILRPRLGR